MALTLTTAGVTRSATALNASSIARNTARASGLTGDAASGRGREGRGGVCAHAGTAHTHTATANSIARRHFMEGAFYRPRRVSCQSEEAQLDDRCGVPAHRR